MTDTDIAQRVADEADIRNVIARLAHLADDGDLEADYVRLFTDDAVWGRPGEEHKGHEDILAGARERRRIGMQGPGTNTHHVNTTLWVSLTGPDEAHAESYWFFVRDTTSAAPVLASIGRYVDDFRRTPHGWKLARRQIQPG
jgi:hypothetical protein